jgi:hypothetical protein
MRYLKIQMEGAVKDLDLTMDSGIPFAVNRKMNLLGKILVND